MASAAPPADPDPIVDLLHKVDATVAVSSKVDNPHDYPEHLVDGKPETAWNSKTGDLKGWIAFRLPKSVRVVRIEITPGFDKTTPKGDLFTMNHRIAKVRVSREGQVLKEATLDTNNRALQAIDVDAPGGDFKIDVLETVPGTEKGWRELTVSELRVWGRAGGAPENPRHIPKMAIGSLDGVPPAKPVAKVGPKDGPYASLDELCATYDRVMTPIIDEAHPDDSYPGRIKPPHCGRASHHSAGGFTHGVFEEAAWIWLNDVDTIDTKLAIRTDKGWFCTRVLLESHYHGDPECQRAALAKFEDVTFAKTSTGQDVALVRLVSRDTDWSNMMQPERNGARSTELAYACRVDAASGIACEGPKTLATAWEPMPPDPDRRDEFIGIKLDKIPWTNRKKPVIGPAGDLRAE